MRYRYNNTILIGGIEMVFAEKPRYRMSIYEQKNEVHVQILGFIRDEVVPEYLEDMTSLIGQVPAHNYTMVVDATEQSPLPRKVAAELGQTMMVYTTLGFKNLRLVMPKSKISFVQVRNALATVNFPGEIVNP